MFEKKHLNIEIKKGENSNKKKRFREEEKKVKDIDHDCIDLSIYSSGSSNNKEHDPGLVQV